MDNDAKFWAIVVVLCGLVCAVVVTCWIVKHGDECDADARGQLQLRGAYYMQGLIGPIGGEQEVCDGAHWIPYRVELPPKR